MDGGQATLQFRWREYGMNSPSARIRYRGRIAAARHKPSAIKLILGGNFPESLSTRYSR
jgi:hypothetical protein